MLTHSIAPHRPPKMTVKQRSRLFTGEIGGDSHRLFIFERTLGDCKVKAGDYVTYKRQKWQVVDVCDDFEAGVVWDGLSANIVTIHLDGEVLCVHPNRLTRTK